MIRTIWTPQNLAAVGQQDPNTIKLTSPYMMKGRNVGALNNSPHMGELTRALDAASPGLGAALGSALGSVTSPSDAPQDMSGAIVIVREECRIPDKANRSRVTTLVFASGEASFLDADDVWTKAVSGLEALILADPATENGNVILSPKDGDTATHATGTNAATRSIKKRYCKDRAFSFIRPYVRLWSASSVDPEHLESIADMVKRNLGLSLRYGHDPNHFAFYGERFDVLENGWSLLDQPDIYRRTLAPANSEEWALILESNGNPGALSHNKKHNITLTGLYPGGSPILIAYEVGVELVMEDYDVYRERCLRFGFKPADIPARAS